MYLKKKKFSQSTNILPKKPLGVRECKHEAVRHTNM